MDENPQASAESEEPDVESNERRWWSDKDDMFLLIQVNNDLPFKAQRTTKAWDQLAQCLLQTPGFGRRFLDGKKAQNRFLNLINAHRKFQNKSLTLSGVNQEETEKTRLLDELVGLIDDYDSMKQSDRESEAAKQQQKEISAMYVREQAMMRGRQKIVDTSETSESSEVDGTVGRKRKLIEEVQAKEIALEQERLAFKKLKFEREMEEREKDRQEREKERQERLNLRVMEQERNAETLGFIRQLLEIIASK